MSDFKRARRVLLIVLVLNLSVALAKLIVGHLTGSIGMQADGLHSLVDGVSNLVGLAGVWLAARPADENHPYGHRKYETLASVAIGALLIFTVVEVLRSAVERLLGGGAPEVSVLSFAVLLVTIAINITVAVWERREGQRLHSDVLIADATQTRGDIFVSLSVIASLALAGLGYPQFDAIVALVVAGLVAHAAWQVVRSASAVLADERVLPEDELTDLIHSVPGVVGTHRLWTRGHQRELFIDLDIRVDAGLTVEQGHAVAHEARRRIAERWPTVRHIMVHVEPVAPDDASTARRVRHLARQRHLNAHDVRVRDTGSGEQIVSLHLEFDPDLTLGEAHDLADELEQAIIDDVPGVTAVTTHIEDEPGAVAAPVDVTAAEPELVERVLRVAASVVGQGRSHDVRLLRHGPASEPRYDVVMHVTLPGALSLSTAHEQAERVERALRRAAPDLGAVTVHAEPPEKRGQPSGGSDKRR